MKVDADKISDSLGLDPIQLDQEAKPVTEYKPKKLDDTTEDDFDFARGNLLNIILKFLNLLL